MPRSTLRPRSFELPPWRRLSKLFVMAAGATLGCVERVDPPGPTALDPEPPPVLPMPSAAATPASAASAEVAPSPRPTLASIAMRTWIYAGPDDRETKLGYLRAGAVVARSEESAGTSNCAGGWYGIEPRGFVCVGKGASLSSDNDVVQATLRGPHRDQNLPYLYVFSAHPAPHFYFRLPSEADQRRVEGSTVGIHILEHRAAVLRAAGEPDEVPPFLAAGRELPKPYGAEKLLHYSVHAGRAKEASAFGLMTTFDWNGRRFGLTTELDLLALDRTKMARPSKVVGIQLTHGGTPGIVTQEGVVAVERDAQGHFHETRRRLSRRTGVELTGQEVGALVETTEGFWVGSGALLRPKIRKDHVGYAEEGRKWIDISIRKQLLVAYEGEKPVYAALISSGRGGMSDPEETHATVRGTFYIHAKHVSATMDGDEASDAFDLRDVPYIQYFHEGYALHAAYWHDDFGKTRSHGCVNLSPADARWLFEWTDPPVPPEWHGAVTPEGGTLVFVHG